MAADRQFQAFENSDLTKRTQDGLAQRAAAPGGWCGSDAGRRACARQQR